MPVKSKCLACRKIFDHSIKYCPHDGTKLATVEGNTSLVGEMLDDRYKIIEIIGEGKSGFIYKAEQVKFKRLVAIKVLNADLLSGEESTKRFHREAKAISKLKHPNLLSIIDFGVNEKKQPYMVTEYLDGITLKAHIKENAPLDLLHILSLFQKICLALESAHSHNVIHRNLEPSNIILAKNKIGELTPKIIDFGLVKFLDDESQNELTKVGQIKGTPAYMSPEQCSGQKLDKRTDIYSVGCILYLAISGKAPFASEDLADLLFKQVKENPPSFKNLDSNLDIPSSVEAIVFKALSKSTDARYQSMKDFAEALKSAYESLLNSQTSIEQAQPEEAMTPANSVEQLSEMENSESAQAANQSSKRQYVMHDAEKDSHKLVAKDHFQRVDEKGEGVFTHMRRRQTEELSNRILNSVKSSFVGDQTMAWLQEVNENVSIDSEQSNQPMCQLSMTALMDKLFNDFQRYAYQFNQTEDNREYVVSCFRPAMSKDSNSVYYGHIQNSIWALKVTGDTESIKFTFIETKLLYNQELTPLSVILELKVKTFDQGPAWTSSDKPIYANELSLISKKIFARLMRVSRGEVTEDDRLHLDEIQETPLKQSAEEAVKESSQDPSDVITFAFISILEAIDEKLISFRDEGALAMKRGGIDAVAPIMLKTKQYDELRESTAELAKQWANMLVD